MPIRPIDMQVAIPKLAEVSRMSHLEQHKGELQQSQVGVTAQRDNQRENQTVTQSNKDERAGSEADARKKGRNEYTRDGKKKQDTNEDNGENNAPEIHHKIDIRI